MTTEPKEPKTTSSRKLVTVAEKAATLRDLLVSRRAELQAALPRHLSPERMLRLVLTACTRNPKLLECTQASVYSAVLQCAQLGLEPDLLGQAFLVPFRDTKKNQTVCQLIPGYLGLLNLARRSGQIASIEGRVVRRGDRFRYVYGLVPVLEHKPDIEAKGAVSHAYAIARFLHGGSPSWEVMTKAEIEEHRARSRAANSGPWVTDWNAMALKTVLRKLCKLLPSSVELATAVALDEAADAGLPQELPTLEPHDEIGALGPEPQNHPPIETDGVTVLPKQETTTIVDDCGCPDAPNGIHVAECKRQGALPL
jgi:recombination protein RecT